jgi:hypothetical protein
MTMPPVEEVALLALAGVRFVADSPVEGDGFEPSVPLGREVPEKSDKTVSTNGLFFTGDQGFESVFLQRRVRCEPDFRGASHR